jgi:hypothetical protein
MRFDGFDSMEGRHLVYAYATVLILQLGYAARVAWQWAKLAPRREKATKPS